MTLVKAVISEASDQDNKHEYYPLSNSITDEGPKKPDVLTTTFQISNIVNEGDYISYIQDMVDVDFLRAIYNFHLSALDDRGYNMNPDTDPPPSRFEVVDHGKFLGNYALDFTNSGDFVSVSNANLQGRLDLQKQFDIMIWFTPGRTQLNDGSDEPILWSYYDFPDGLEIGITGTNGNDASWRGFVRIGTGAVNTITGSSQTVMNDTSGDEDPVLIRVYRGGDNVIRMEINGIEDATFSTASSLNPSNQEMIFGDGNATETNKEYVGLIHQIRIYCGNTLTKHQADIVRWAKPQVMTKKFSGKIWKVKDNEASKTSYALANSQGLVSLKLSTNDTYDLSVTSLSDVLAGVITSINSDPSIQDFTLKIAPDVPFTFVPIDPPSTLIGNMYETGSFLDFINILLVWTQTIFYTTPNNLLIIEPKDGRDSNVVFDQDSETTPYDVTVTESNDINIYNQIIVRGRAGTDVFETGPSVNDIRRTLRKNVLQLDDSDDVEEFGLSQLNAVWGDEDYPNANSKPPIRYDIKITSLLNSVRYNQKVNIVNSKKNIDLDVIISQITTSYPSGNMHMTCNNTTIDYYDQTEQLVNPRNELQDETFQ